MYHVELGPVIDGFLTAAWLLSFQNADDVGPALN
jgi:hypothetical protein